MESNSKGRCGLPQNTLSISNQEGENAQSTAMNSMTDTVHKYMANNTATCTNRTFSNMPHALCRSVLAENQFLIVVNKMLFNNLESLKLNYLNIWSVIMSHDY